MSDGDETVRQRTVPQMTIPAWDTPRVVTAANLSTHTHGPPADLAAWRFSDPLDARTRMPS